MSSATSLSRLKFGSLILYGELFFGFDLFYFKCSTTGHTDKVTIFELRQDKEVIKFSLAIKFNLILHKLLNFALATLYILFIRIPNFNLLSMVNPSGFTDFDDSIFL